MYPQKHARRGVEELSKETLESKKFLFDFERDSKELQNLLKRISRSKMQKKGDKMTLIVENVKQEFLKDFKALAKKAEAKLSIEQADDFQHLREYMLQDLKKPENKAVFERLKDK